ncbi:MAG: exo-alpha-sialidase [Ruminococcaceae bacterium]|nr:exo-alpha-sialidase [Oscillospiraceae bacterium]
MLPHYKIGDARPIEKANGKEYALCRIPGMVLTAKNTLIAYYECRSEVSDWARIDIRVIRSTDLGDSFSEVLLIKGEGDTLNNPVMTVKDGVIHFTFLRNYNRLYYCKSTDDGKSFSTPKDITHVLEEGGKYTVAATGPGHGIVCGGNILIPLWFGYNPNDPMAHHPSAVRTLYSQNDGESWRLGDIIGGDVLTDANESAFALTDDGKVLVSVRHCTEGKRNRAIAKSPNGYSDWSKAEFCDMLPDPRCMGSMFSYDGRIYHINCVSPDGRKDLTLKISDDNFRTYEAILISKLGGYSDIAVNDEHVFIFFERDVLHKNDPENNDGLYFVRLDVIK